MSSLFYFSTTKQPKEIDPRLQISGMTEGRDDEKTAKKKTKKSPGLNSWGIVFSIQTLNYFVFMQHFFYIVKYVIYRN